MNEFLIDFSKYTPEMIDSTISSLKELSQDFTPQEFYIWGRNRATIGTVNSEWLEKIMKIVCGEDFNEYKHGLEDGPWVDGICRYQP